MVAMLCLSTLASAADFRVDSPLTDGRSVIAGRLGSSPGDVSARALFVNGQRSGLSYTQAGGEVLLQGGLHFFQTSFGAVFGAEADFSLGGESNETSSDGTLRDQRKDNLTTAERMKSVVWVTSRLGLRAALSLPIWQPGRTAAFRLGGLGGVTLDANGSRSFLLSPVFTAGAQLSFVLGPLAGLFTYMAIPTQSEFGKQTATAHKVTLELGVGPVLGGASMGLHDVAIASVRGLPAAALTSTTLAFHLGYRFPALNVR